MNLPAFTCTSYDPHILRTQIITSSSFSLNEQTAKELMDMAHQGMKLLTGWTTAVMELVRVRGQGVGLRELRGRGEARRAQGVGLGVLVRVRGGARGAGEGQGWG